MVVTRKTSLIRTSAPVRKPAGDVRPQGGSIAFHGLLEPLIVEEPSGLEFLGAVSREDANACWGWMQHQLAPDLLGNLPNAELGGAAQLEKLLPALLQRADAELAAQKNAPEARGVRAFISAPQAGDAKSALPAVVNTLKYRSYIPQARQFGQAANGLSEKGLIQALSVLPVSDPGPFSVLIYSAVTELLYPARMVQAVIRIAGLPNEAAIGRAGHVPVIDALLVRALEQLIALRIAAKESKIEAMCKAIDRYHRLARAVTAFIELPRRGRWTHLAGTMTKQMSDLIEPLLHRVAPDVNRALRKPRDGEKPDEFQMRAAIESCRLLATVRDCRDSLAVNAVCEQTWTQTGELIEAHIQRMMEQLRATPGDIALGERIDAAIAMAGFRFGTDYAEVLRRGRETVSRRAL